MSTKETWGASVLYGTADAITLIVNTLLHPAISQEIVELPVKTWEEVMIESLNETRKEK